MDIRNSIQAIFSDERELLPPTDAIKAKIREIIGPEIEKEVRRNEKETWLFNNDDPNYVLVSFGFHDTVDYCLDNYDLPYAAMTSVSEDQHLEIKRLIKDKEKDPYEPISYGMFEGDDLCIDCWKAFRDRPMFACCKTCFNRRKKENEELYRKEHAKVIKSRDLEKLAMICIDEFSHYFHNIMMRTK